MVDFLLALEESELPFFAGGRRGKGIFDDAGNGRVGHHQTTWAATLELMGQQTEGIGITLEVGDVVPKRFRYLFAQRASGTFGEKRLDGLLTTMSERWVTQVVG